MWYSATIHAYDCLDSVVVTARIHTFDRDTSGTTLGSEALKVQVRGSGEDDSHRWLRDALVALAETL